MPVINVQMLKGRTEEQKATFIKEVAGVAMRTLQVPEQAVVILISEVAQENWGAGTRTMAEIRSAQSK